MKTPYLIGGPMGVGKTAVAGLLKSKLDHSVILDGDTCWTYHSTNITKEDKKNVIKVIIDKINTLLSNKDIEVVIFTWVMHEQLIIDEITSGIKCLDICVISISLLAKEETLIKRLEIDINGGVRTSDVIHRSLERLKHYASLDTYKINTDDMSIDQVADKILASRNS